MNPPDSLNPCTPSDLVQPADLTGIAAETTAKYLGHSEQADPKAFEGYALTGLIRQALATATAPLEQQLAEVKRERNQLQQRLAMATQALREEILANER